MAESPNIEITATDPQGRMVVAYSSTLASHRIKHREPFSNAQIVECIEDPDIIAKTGHPEPEMRNRLIYYKDKDFGDGGPGIMKAVVEHGEEPGVLTSAFRTSRRSKDGKVVYIEPGYFSRRMP